MPNEPAAARYSNWKLRQVAARIIPGYFWLLGVFVGLLLGAFLEGIADGRKAWVWAWTRQTS